MLTPLCSCLVWLGAGRLGLGLVLPAMVRSGVPFAVLQRPSSSWNEILQSTPDSPHLQLAINGQVGTRAEAAGGRRERRSSARASPEPSSAVSWLWCRMMMQVVCDDMVVVRDLTELPPSEPQQANLFVLSEDPLLLHLLITTASSFSISLGEAARPRTCSEPTYPPLTSTSRVSSLPLNLTCDNPCAFPVVISRRSEHAGRGGSSAEQAPSRASRRQAAQPLRRRERPQRTCVVSPHGMLLHMLGAAIGRGTERGPGMLLFVVQMVTELAKQLEGRVDVIHCMVDRICVDRSIEPRAIGVKCEPYEGEMVIMRRASNGLPPPFEGQFIRSPAMDAQVRRARQTGQRDAAVEGTRLTCQCCCTSSACHRRSTSAGASS